MDEGTDAAGVGPLPVSPPANSPIRWDFFGNPNDFKSGPNPIPQYTVNSPGGLPAACTAKALAVDGGTPGAATAAVNLFGCYAQGSSVMIPPALGTFGTMGRNIFPDSGFRELRFLGGQELAFWRTLRAQFRAEFFNIFNHPNFANPYGGQNGFGLNDPSAGKLSDAVAPLPTSPPRTRSSVPEAPRSVQLGLKVHFLSVALS